MAFIWTDGDLSKERYYQLIQMKDNISCIDGTNWMCRTRLSQVTNTTVSNACYLLMSSC